MQLPCGEKSVKGAYKDHRDSQVSSWTPLCVDPLASLNLGTLKGSTWRGVQWLTWLSLIAILGSAFDEGAAPRIYQAHDKGQPT